MKYIVYISSKCENRSSFLDEKDPPGWGGSRIEDYLGMTIPISLRLNLMGIGFAF